MDIGAELDEFEAAFFSGDRREALQRLSAFIDGCNQTAARRGDALDEIAARLGHEHVGFGSFLALAGGALVESGGPAGAVGRAIIAPLTRALENAQRMVPLVAALPDSEDDADEEEEEDDDDDEGVDRVDIAGKRLTREQLDALADQDLAAVQAWFSLDTWYRPAVATWTRETSI